MLREFMDYYENYLIPEDEKFFRPSKYCSTSDYLPPRTTVGLTLEYMTVNEKYPAEELMIVCGISRKELNALYMNGKIEKVCGEEVYYKIMNIKEW